jgi:hypothetical protein
MTSREPTIDPQPVSGGAVSGNMGSRHKFNYTVMGDAVNLASRLEGANKPYGTTLMVSQSCYEKARDAIEVRELDLLAVKGKREPVAVCDVLEEKGRVEPRVAEAVRYFHKGLARYRAQDFSAALARFERGPSGRRTVQGLREALQALHRRAAGRSLGRGLAPEGEVSAAFFQGSGGIACASVKAGRLGSRDRRALGRSAIRQRCDVW